MNSTPQICPEPALLPNTGDRGDRVRPQRPWLHVTKLSRSGKSPHQDNCFS